jgi:hypothetical protein
MKGCIDFSELHIPAVQMVAGKHHIVCRRCGLMLDFRSLEDLGFNVSDWFVPDYEAPG